MTVTLEDLLTPQTQDEIDQAQLDALESLGLPTTSWADGDPTKTLVELQGETMVDLWKQVPAIAKGGYLSTAEGAWLDLCGQELVEEFRYQGTAATHQVELKVAAGSGAIPLTVRQLWINDPVTRRRFVGPVTATTLADGSMTPVTFVAEAIGIGYNLGPNRLSKLLTPLPGLSVISSVLVTQGTEVESDDLYRQRCIDKRGSKGLCMNDEGFRYVLRTASEEITRVSVVEVDGDVETYIAGPSGPCGSGTVTTADAAIQAKRVLGVLCSVAPAASLPVLGEMVVEVAPGYGSIATVINDTWLQYLSELEDGDQFNRDDLVVRIRKIPGVRGVPLGAFISPSADFTIPAITVPVLTSLALTVQVTS